MIRRLLLPALLALLTFAAFQWRVKNEMVDFGVYRQAASRALHAEPLYRESDGHYQFKYLPAFAVATAPFASIDEDSAKLLWFAMSVGALILLLRLSARFMPEQRRGMAWLIGLTLLVMAKFYAHELVLGQANLLFGVLIVVAIGAIQMELPAVAGALVGAAVCVKPYAVIFIPWLAVTEGRRAVLASIAVCAVALLAPSVLYGVGGNFALLGAWWHTVSSTTAPNLLGNDNVSFAAMWAKWLGPGVIASVLAALTSIAGVAAVVDAWRRREGITEPSYLEAAALLLLVPLLSPQGWDYVLLLGTPAVALLIDRAADVPVEWRLGTWIFFVLMGIISFDLIGRAAYGRYMSWSIVSVAATAILVALLRLRRERLA